MTTLRVLPEADGEAIAAALWYEERAAGLGDAFLQDLKDGLEAVRQQPDHQSLLETYHGSHEIRRRLLSRFPYAIIFRYLPEEILVVAIVHGRRRPLYWRDRIL